MQPFFETSPMRFSCTCCGQCCATAGEYYVYLTRAEAERIRVFLDLSVAWFRRRYLSRLEDGVQVLASSANERCIFLDRQGQCRIYPVRPLQCRTYPFWPELVNRRRDWQREAGRCEGIGNGPVVSKRVIRRALRLCQATTD